MEYSVGQPMGAYSSWAVMALTHHTIVRWSAIRAGFPASFADYHLLGDDLVINSALVASEYRKIIRGLGMDISEEKSLVSRDTFEFAKRIFIQGVEVSHWPLKALAEGSRKHYVLAASLIPLIERGYIPDPGEGLELGFPLVR